MKMGSNKDNVTASKSQAIKNIMKAARHLDPYDVYNVPQFKYRNNISGNTNHSYHFLLKDHC